MAIPNKSTASATKATDLLIKVCGMRDQENIVALTSLQPDFIGFIFYSESKRYAGKSLKAEEIKQLPDTIKKVGVFVNEPLKNILKIARQYTLQAIQLHGDELPEQCRQIREQGYIVLKAFALDEHFDFNILAAYEGTCDFYLFDTKGPQYGGNGLTFNWELLNKYTLPTPFFLSGGLDLEHEATIKAGRWPQLKGIDLNSRFEVSPGLKDIDKVGQMLEACRYVKPMVNK
ncbi:MAG: Phosphoribosylanthranilate isomerase [uncultured Adhaeribacter sp.]|uniref:N-(5'-phosphoribosyl)anthranilate isomerase n=1 Tax=uncultured Adhaeribacter sp. TaxID=448109 RepID=A0A6J4IGB1_9BACT|nr:MAG: Phosphoribosylanthranilate isomerase [uncultured Adhaeribacter sp.]